MISAAFDPVGTGFARELTWLGRNKIMGNDHQSENRNIHGMTPYWPVCSCEWFEPIRRGKHPMAPVRFVSHNDNNIVLL